MKLRNMTALYIKRNQQFLLLYRIGSRVVEPSWCGIGGHFEENELNDPLCCVLRECKEEIGIHQDQLEQLLLRYVTLRQKNGEIRQNYYYFAKLKDQVEPHCCNEGILQWVNQEEMLDLTMTYTAKQILTHYLKEGYKTSDIYGVLSKKDHTAILTLDEF